MERCPTQGSILRELETLAPRVPLLALGQTVFWDEPMKAGVVHALREIGSDRSVVAGVHDTDYFAKFPSGGQSGKFKALAHNDTTTKGLWSAAGEFSCLFGSETVVTREALADAGVKLHRVVQSRPGLLDEVTEAWGWRGVVSLSDESRVTAEKKLSRLFAELYDTFQWAVDETMRHVVGAHRERSLEKREELISLVCHAADDESQTLSDYYEKLIPLLWKYVGDAEVETTRTSRLLQFNSQTATRPRFQLVELFLDPRTAGQAQEAYNAAVRGSEIYTLDRFGVGALPFDLVIPGVGRGTLRLGTRGGVVMSHPPVGFSYKKRPESAQELAEILEKRFGPDCVLVGKAVTLIGMLAKEYVFVFHDGASGYVHRSRHLHQQLGHQVYPLLRVRYEPWDALKECSSWLALPEPMRRPFGVDELSGPSLAVRWREVVGEQENLLTRLKGLTRPLDLVKGLQQIVGGHWECLSQEFQQIDAQLQALATQIQSFRAQKRQHVERVRALKRELNDLQHAKGRHWRDKLFGQTPTEEALAERAQFQQREKDLTHQISEAWAAWRAVQAQQDDLVASESVTRVLSRRDAIGLEAELTRVKLVREAVTTAKGLVKAGHRPSAWWFPLVCPDGTWFRATTRTACYWLEPLN